MSDRKESGWHVEDDTIDALMTMKDLHLRNVQEGDCHLLYEWANDPEARAASFSSDPIAWEEHVQWFRCKFADPHCHIFISCTQEEQPIGYVRFECEGDAATVSISIDAAWRGKGLACPLIMHAATRLFETTDTKRIHAYIKPANEASQKLFRRAGYEQQEQAEVSGHPALHFVLYCDMLRT